MTQKLSGEEWRKVNWIWFWSGNWPLFDEQPFFTRRYQNEWKKAIGYAPQVFVGFYKKGTVYAYLCQKDQDILEKTMVSLFHKRPSFILETLKPYEQNTKRDLLAIKRIIKKDYKSISDFSLASLFLEARSHLEYNSFMDHYDYYLERYLGPIIESYVKRKIKNQSVDKISSLTSLLITPHRKTPIFKERNAFLKIIQLLKKDTIFKKEAKIEGIKILKDYPKYEVLIDRHQKKYGYLTEVVNAESISKKDLWQDIQKFVIQNEPFRIQAKRMGDDYNEATINKAKVAIKKLKPDYKTGLLIKGIRRAVYLRTIDNAFQGYTTHLLKLLYLEIANRLGITYQEFKFLLDQEIVDHLRNNKKISKAKIKQRLQFCSYTYYYGEVKTSVGQKVKQQIRIVEQGKSEHKQTSFKGKAACLGKIKGSVIVAFAPKDAKNIKKGQILVTQAPSAYFVPVLRKASGIITEYGGLTNHAVIVSREKNTPCIVGIEGITKHLQNGDLVEVDADKGIVTKL